MKKLSIVVAVLGIAGIAFAADKAAAPAAATDKPVAAAALPEQLINPAKAKWMSISGDEKKGPWVTPVQGDSQKEAFTAYLKMSAGGDSGWHTHDSDYSAVVIEGSATHQDQGGKEFTATAGQSWTSKGGVNHKNTCKGKKDCVLFLAARGAFSFHPKTAEGADVPMPAAKTN